MPSPVVSESRLQDTPGALARSRLVGVALCAVLTLCGIVTLLAAPASAQSAPRQAVDAATRQAIVDTVRAVLARAVADSAFPGAFAAVGSATDIYIGEGAGHIDWQPSPVPDDSTLWDLASLTKVIATTTVVMQLWDAHRINLDAPVSRYVPAFRGPGKSKVTIRRLLTHTSGMPGWRPLYLEASSPAAILALVDSTRLDTLPGKRTEYSDLGIIVLGQAVARLTGESLDRYAAAHVFGPMGMRNTMFRPDSALRPRIAPTERDPWRGRQLRGEVHDENAYALGGVSSHAGLFSTGRDLARFAQMYLQRGKLDGKRIVSAAAIDTFTTIQDSVLSRRALGWETADGHNSGGRRLSPKAFGHTGFTGTSIWIDPTRDLFVLLLTNRVNPTRENHRIAGVRTALADAVVGALDGAHLAPSSAATSPTGSPP